MDKLLRPLDDLYDKTGYDWDLQITHALTEPTCPVVWITPLASKADKKAPEGVNGLVGEDGSIDKVVRRAVDVLVKRFGLV